MPTVTSVAATVVANITRELKTARAQGARARIRADVLPARPQGSRTGRGGGTPWGLGNRQQHLARDADDERHDHDGEEDSRGQKTDAVDRTAQERDAAEP